MQNKTANIVYVLFGLGILTLVYIFVTQTSQVNNPNSYLASVSRFYVETYTRINGSCGSNGYTCQSGQSSNFSTSTTQYVWNCNGTNGGSNASCTAFLPINAVCGTTNNGCAMGTLNDITDSETNYLWNCRGLYSGANASCSLPIPPPSEDEEDPDPDYNDPGGTAPPWGSFYQRITNASSTYVTIPFSYASSTELIPAPVIASSTLPAYILYFYPSTLPKPYGEAIARQFCVAGSKISLWTLPDDFIDLSSGVKEQISEWLLEKLTADIDLTKPPTVSGSAGDLNCPD